MGTRLDVLVIDKSRWESYEVWSDIVSELRRLDYMFNRFDEASEVSVINKKAAVEDVITSREMWTVLQSCKSYHYGTLGLFDITLCDFKTVILKEDNQSVAFSAEGVSLDFGGYAKGYALARIKDIMQQAGVKQAFIDFGNSSIMAIGRHPFGDAWKVSVQNPYHIESILDEISLKDQALSVSGNTPGYSGHIIQPTSGKAFKDRKMVAVAAHDPLDAEVLSTVFMIANENEKAQISINYNILHETEYNIE